MELIRSFWIMVLYYTSVSSASGEKQLVLRYTQTLFPHIILLIEI